MPLDHTFTTALVGDMGPHRWTYAILPGSQAILSSGKAVKVTAEVDGAVFSTSMPPYRGGHMLPVKRDILCAIDKAAGDDVVVRITDAGT